MSPATAAIGLVLLLCVQVIQSERDWGVTYTPTEICALKGSTVVIRCSYRYPSRTNGLDTTVQNTLWFTELNGNVPVDLRRDSQYSGRVEHICKNNICTLRIRDVRESDSAEYKFMFRTHQADERFTGSPGVTLSVTDLQVKVEKSSLYDWTKLTCVSSCQLPDHPSYIWYKSGQKVPVETSNSYSDYINSADSFSCAVKGQEAFPSPPMCVTDQTCNRVTYTQRSICAFKGSSVDISCTYNSHGDQVESKFWFSPEHSLRWQNLSQPEDLREDAQFKGRVSVFERVSGIFTLRISNLTERDSDEFRFKFRTRNFEWGSSLPGTTLTVTALQVQVIRISVRDSYTEAELKCLSSCNPADRLSYVWFKNKQEITEVKTSSYKGWFDLNDTISCALEGHENFGSPPVLIQSENDWGVTYTSTEICALKGSTVVIRCWYWYPYRANGRYTTIQKTLWFTELNGGVPVDLRRDSQYSGRVEHSCESDICTLRIRDVRESDSAEYKFVFTTTQPGGRFTGSPGVTLSVTDLQVKVERYSYSSWAKLTCVSSCQLPDHPSYIWYKSGQKVPAETSYYYYSDYFNSADRYSCAVNGQEAFPSPPVYPPKLPSVSVSPSGEIVEGSSVNLTCSSDANPAANYTWYKENEELPKASGQIFTITAVRAEHSGNYYCEVWNKLGIHASTLHLTVVSESTKMINIIRLTLVVVLLIPLLLLCLWMRKKKLSSTTGPNKLKETMEMREMFNHSEGTSSVQEL